MGNWMRAALAAVVCGALSVEAVAQTMTVPKDPTVGQTITIGYSDPGRAGATITVTIDNGGFPSKIVVEKEITLDGRATAAWSGSCQSGWAPTSMRQVWMSRRGAFSGGSCRSVTPPMRPIWSTQPGATKARDVACAKARLAHEPPLQARQVAVTVLAEDW